MTYIIKWMKSKLRSKAITKVNKAFKDEQGEI